MYFIYICCFLFLVYYLNSNAGKSVALNANAKGSNVVLFLFFVFFVFILSFQYDVGTDYFSYVSLFKGNYIDLYKRKQEYLFYHLCKFLSENNIHPQVGFLLCSIIQFVCICSFLKFLKLKSNLIFFFLFFTVSTFFFNQSNGIRQYTAATILLLSIKNLYEKKYIRMLLSVLIATLFHSSAVLFLSVLFVIKFFLHRFKNLIWIIYLIISIIMIKVNIVTFIIKFIPFLSRYSHYLDSLWGTNQIPMVNILTKLIYVPFYLISLKSLSKLYENKDIFLFQLGFFSYGVKLICLSSPILNRFAAYFEIFTIFPLYYFLCDFFSRKIKVKHFNQFFIFIFYLISIGMLCLKTVIMPSAEYEYKSIFMAIFKGIYIL